MDVLSSQANLAGYRAVVEASTAYDKGFPMMMTAAGTVPAANTFIMGAGVAGLQAIATARRLGGRVSATDVRPAAKEEIKSLGASFVGYEDEESKAAQTAGGYAKQLSAAFYAKQAEVVAAHIAKQDVVVGDIVSRTLGDVPDERMMVTMVLGVGLPTEPVPLTREDTPATHRLEAEAQPTNARKQVDEGEWRFHRCG
jgi:NADPH:quinone reductase-like Zn-dependent oxidoreductase